MLSLQGRGGQSDSRGSQHGKADFAKGLPNRENGVSSAFGRQPVTNRQSRPCRSSIQ